MTSAIGFVSSQGLSWSLVLIRALRTVALTLTVVAPLSAAGQGTSGFVPGARTIVDLEFSGSPVGDFPKGLRLLQGNMDVVDKNGVRMLRASSPSEFVLQLPEALPKDFTLEVELIPKACCNPVDFAVEGVISGSRSSVSAQLEWDADHFAVVGGNPQMFQMDMPASIAATLPSTLTKVAMSFEDETVKMYTNGRRLYTLAERKFVRGRVLRIWLGGQDEDKYAVYLARVRVADLAAAIITSNAPQAGPRSVTTGAPTASTPAPTLPNVGGQPATSTSSASTGSTTQMGVNAVLTGTATPMPAPSTTTASSPTRPPGTTGGPVTIMNDATAPTVGVTATAGGLKVSYTQVAGASNYTICRESPPGGTCTTTAIGAGAEILGNVVSHYDLGLTPGSTHAYRVTAFRPDGHFGQSAAVSGVADPFPAPQNLRVVRVNNAPAEAVLMWDRVPYADYNGMQTVGSYLVWRDGRMLTTVSGPQVTIPILPGQGTYQLEVAAAAPAPMGGTRASLSYTCRYRIVAQAILVNHATGDNMLLFDGAQDEVFLATVLGLTNRALAAPVVSTVKSETYGDVAGFPKRIRAGSATPTGGLRTGDKIFASLNTSAPAGAPSSGFPLLIWEGPMDDQTVLVSHSAIFETDNVVSRAGYGDWATTVWSLVKSSFGNQVNTVQGIQQHVDNADFGPVLALVDVPGGANASVTFCTSALYINPGSSCVDGDDRPIGLNETFKTVLEFRHNFLVFTRAAIEKSLGKPPSPQPIAGAPGFLPGPGTIVIDFRDGTSVPPMGSGDYTLILRIERIP